MDAAAIEPSSDLIPINSIALRSFNEATAGTHSVAQPDQPAGVIKRLSFRSATSVSRTGSFLGRLTNRMRFRDDCTTRHLSSGLAALVKRR
jgi:hypothetical protein